MPLATTSAAVLSFGVLVIHGAGLINVPIKVTSTNTYYNVPTLRTGGCP